MKTAIEELYQLLQEYGTSVTTADIILKVKEFVEKELEAKEEPIQSEEIFKQNRKLRQELISSIRPNAANFDYIKNSPHQTINGSLFIDIDRIMEKYANERLNAEDKPLLQWVQSKIDNYNRIYKESFSKLEHHPYSHEIRVLEEVKQKIESL